jgi:NAD(P)-dependent dehydrogenase (short-subunit alcohol dehydrogenase family)
MSKWTADDIPDQTGKVAIITGANSGLGRIDALELTRHGAQVIIASRSIDKGEAAAAEIIKTVGGLEPIVRRLDLGNLDSIRAFADEFTGQCIDLLLNNAGVMMTPYGTTSDGFETQFGTNHLGHFALTGLLLEALERAPAGRIMTVSSTAHKGGSIDFDDLQFEHGYNPRAAYQRSKLANAIFAIELDRRLRASKSPAISVFAHPGYAATNLQSTGPTGIMKQIMKVTNLVIAQPPEKGVLPALYAATAPGVKGGEFFGPDGPGEHRGLPKRVKATSKAYDPKIGAQLWRVSEELTGVKYPRQSDPLSVQ